MSGLTCRYCGELLEVVRGGPPGGSEADYLGPRGMWCGSAGEGLTLEQWAERRSEGDAPHYQYHTPDWNRAAS
jgi:hypothetical protein